MMSFISKYVLSSQEGILLGNIKMATSSPWTLLKMKRVHSLNVSNGHCLCCFALALYRPLALHVTLNKWCFVVLNPLHSGL